MISTAKTQKFCITFELSSASAFTLDKVKLCLYYKVNPLPHNPVFYVTCRSDAYENITQDNVTSTVSFSNNVFYPIIDRNYHFSHIYFVTCNLQNAFNLVQSTILSFGKVLTLYHTIPTFRTSGTESF